MKEDEDRAGGIAHVHQQMDVENVLGQILDQGGDDGGVDVLEAIEQEINVMANAEALIEEEKMDAQQHEGIMLVAA